MTIESAPADSESAPADFESAPADSESVPADCRMPLEQQQGPYRMAGMRYEAEWDVMRNEI